MPCLFFVCAPFGFEFIKNYAGGATYGLEDKAFKLE
jgi:hypothetical protein